MSKIRKLYYFDKKNMKEMIPFLNNKDAYINHFMFNPFLPLHHMLPLKLKFLPESYVLKEHKDIKGLITVAPLKSSIQRLEIQRLFFDETCYEEAEELVQYVLSKYKAMGAYSFIVKVNDTLPELVNLFVARCNFSQISYEKLWKIVPPSNNNFDNKKFRTFRNSDITTVSSLYNESLLPHFRTLLSSSTEEFKESIFKGLSYFNEYKYILEDKSSKNISCYISIKTYDNQNYVLDIIHSSWIELDIDEIISFSIKQIEKRQKNYTLFIKTKKYTQLGEKYEKMFIDKHFKCVQSQIVLTNSSAQIIKEKVRSGKYTVLSQFYDSGINVPG